MLEIGNLQKYRKKINIKTVKAPYNRNVISKLL